MSTDLRPRRISRANRAARAVGSLLMSAAMVGGSLFVPVAAVAAPVGQGFTVSPADLAFILKQIKIAEAHVANTTSLTGPCGALVGPGPNQIASSLVSEGLRTVDGTCNNLVPGQETFGAADMAFPRLTTPVFVDAEVTPSGFGPPAPTSYAQTSGNVFDSEPRMISNLIVDQTSANPAAVAAAGFPIRSQGNEGVVPCTVDPTPADPNGTPDNCVPEHETLDIPNVTTDVGLSPPFNSLFTIFGQFFDHGLDKITNGGSGTVFVPLKADDPLVAGPNHIFGDADDLPAQLRFMVLTRGTTVDGPDDDADGVNGRSSPNTDTPFIDQSQTYTSHASHQVFLREYVNNVDGKPVATGKFLSSADGGLATWAMIKSQAAILLGLELVDSDVNDIPMIAADAYGKFIPGPDFGLPQYVTTTGGLIEGDRSNPVPVPPNAIRIGTAFLNDIAHSAGPGSIASPKTPDADLTAGGSLDPVASGEYDNELLEIHAICGDGRCNENIALQAVHQIFHNEHDRLVGDIKSVLLADAIAASGITSLADWQTALGAGGWNGERLFQAARFVTEMQYQHLVFEEFARKVQPGINPFEPFAFNQTDVNPAITAEFAHAVYRFGHSMLTDSIPRVNEDGSHFDIALLDGFLNPAAYDDGGRLSSSQAAGSIIMGLSDQVGQEIDEFVVETLRNNLLGLPLDLPTINMTRARSEGIPSLNNVRRQIFNATNDGQLTPYTDWVDYGQVLKHPESLVNFIAAYGTHPTIVAETTLAGRRTAADQIVNGTILPGPDGILNDNPLTFIDESLDDTPAGPGGDGIFGTDCGTATPSPECLDDVPVGPGPDGVLGDNPLTVIDESADNILPPADSADFMFSTAAWANTGTTSITGLDDIDLWMGGLAERTNLFGGLLGSTFNYVFENQMTNLQNGDRFYYLARTPGMNLRAQLEGNSFAELVMRNTNAHTLKADPFATADCKFELQNITWPGLTVGSSGILITGAGSVQDDPASDCDENEHLLRMSDGTIRYRMTNTAMPSGINAQAVYNGKAGVVNDRIWGGADNDTFWGGEGKDTIEGGDGADIALGGEGNDIITDLAGDDVPKGGPGNDAIDGGPGLDIIMGGDGNDFSNGGANTNETFGGAGDDFILAGQGMDAVFGDSGDDWAEGGDQPDLLIGDSSSLFFDDHNLPGHDILIGQGGDDDYDLEGGDDIGVAGPGVEKIAGAAGYDWEIGLADPQAQDMDLAQVFIAGGVILPGVRDKFNEVEALSGWNLNDTLRGDDIVPAAVGGGGFVGCDALDAAGVARISGLDALVPASLRTVDSADLIAASATNHCLLTGLVWGDGNILLGGAGSDLLEGRGANDILDGDRYVNVRLSIRTDPASAATEIGSTDLMTHAALSGNFGAGTTGKTLQQAVFAGLVDPGNIVAVRELLQPANGTAVDTALFGGTLPEYLITFNDDGSVTVAHTAPVGGGGGVGIDDGIDTLWNMERAQFADQLIDLTGNQPATGTVTINGLPATENGALTATVVISDPNGPAVITPTLNWQVETATGTFVNVATGDSFTPDDPQVGHRLRLAATFTDNAGNLEQVLSDPTAVVVNVNDVPTGAPTLNPTFPQKAELVTATAAIADADGLVGVTLRFQWQQDPIGAAPFANIVGATGPTFRPTQAQVGLTLRVVVTYTDNHGTPETVLSAASGVVGDVFVGTAGNDSFAGTAGRDNASGLAGNDVLSGAAADDVIIGGADNDTLNGGAGNDLFRVGVGDGFDSVTGGADTDTIAAQANGTVIGLTLLNTIEAITGGAFTGVTIAADDAGRTLSFATVTLTNIGSISGGLGNDTITGSAAADVILGRAGIDNLNGGGGADTITGGTDTDTLNGAAGNDTFPVSLGDGFDAVIGGTETDTIAAQANNVVVGLISIASMEAITGGAFTGVTIAGDAANNTLNFGAVTLTNIGSIDGGAGADTITGSAANDVIVGGTGDDALNGGTGDDTFRINVGDGFDAVNGAGGTADAIEVLASNTVIGLSSLAGIEVINAGAFSGVTILGTPANNSLNFTGATLTGIGSIDGGAGLDTITGTAGDDVLLGGAGNDTINGGNGLDTITGGANDDTMNGGNHADTFKFAALFGADTIAGFDADPAGTGNTAGQDKLDISALTGINAGNFATSVTITASGTNVLVTVTGGGTILVNGTTATITSADFILAP